MASSHPCSCLVRSIACSICSKTALVRCNTSSFQNRRTVEGRQIFAESFATVAAAAPRQTNKEGEI